MKLNTAIMSAVIISCFAALKAFAMPDTYEAPSALEQVRLAQSLAPSMVQVEYILQFDRGEAPRGTGWGERCPGCGRFHGNPIESLLREERTLKTAGFLVSPTRIVAPDIQVHPRFLSEIRVLHDGNSTEAQITRYAIERNAVIIDIQKPIPQTEPLSFDAQKEGPYAAVTYIYLNGEWSVNIQPLPGTVTVPSKRQPYIAAPSFAVIIDQEGTPVALSMREDLPVDGSWKGSPLEWSLISADELQQSLTNLEQITDAALLRVSLGLRSPRADPADNFRSFYSSRDDDDAAQRDEMGLLAGPDLVLVLADMSPRVTARLENVHLVHPEAGRAAAQFYGSLKELGALVVVPDTPIPGALQLSNKDITEYRNQLLLMAEFEIQGEQRVIRFSHGRISSFDTGWREQLHPELSGPTQNVFLFDLEGQLIAFPMQRRDTDQGRRYYRRSHLTPVEYVRGIISEPEDHFDMANIPLSEEEENRLAWIGVELQALDSDLARANQVADQTRDGDTGALVIHVYPDSPAGQAGIEPGMILLRVRIDGRPQPMDVRIDDSGYLREFPWAHLDEIPEQYFDRIPSPWPPVENRFNRMLTDLGVGTEFTAEFFHRGELMEKHFTVVTGPAHYGSARNYKSDALGLTVRDLTYDVRRYLQQDEDEPGVVIARVEAGTRASVAGIKPYELITHVNNEPVHTVGDFEKLSTQGGELSFSIKRMASGRIVRITAQGN